MRADNCAEDGRRPAVVQLSNAGCMKRLLDTPDACSGELLSKVALAKDVSGYNGCSSGLQFLGSLKSVAVAWLQGPSTKVKVTTATTMQIRRQQNEQT